MRKYVVHSIGCDWNDSLCNENLGHSPSCTNWRNLYWRQSYGAEENFTVQMFWAKSHSVRENPEKKVGIRKKRENCSNFSFLFQPYWSYFLARSTNKMSVCRRFYPLLLLFQKFLATTSSWRENEEKHVGKTQSVEMSNLISVLHLQLKS